MRRTSGSVGSNGSRSAGMPCMLMPPNEVP